MSLPTGEDLRLDRILQHLDRVIQSYSKPHHAEDDSADELIWRATIRDMRQYMQQIDYYLSRGELGLVGYEEMLLWMGALDHLLFDDLIFTHCRRGIDLGWGEGNNRLGWFNFSGDLTVVRLVPKRSNSIELIGTLLHEMVHAFIAQMARFEGVYYRTAYNQELAEVFRGLTGATGHGYYFQKLARAVEDRARQLLGYDNIKLGRLSSMVVEYQRSKQIPTGAYFEAILKAPKYADQFEPEAARDWIVRFDERERLRRRCAATVVEGHGLNRA